VINQEEDYSGNQAALACKQGRYSKLTAHSALPHFDLRSSGINEKAASRSKWALPPRPPVQIKCGPRLRQCQARAARRRVRIEARHGERGQAILSDLDL